MLTPRHPPSSAPAPAARTVAGSTVAWREVVIDGWHTGALDIGLTNRRILSIPTQLGCRAGCTFCVSSTAKEAKNLSVSQMLALIQACLEAKPADERPLELSFTGEGEPVLNWRAAAEVCRQAPAVCRRIESVRYCFSGLGAPRLLGCLDAAGLPCRLQFSLHTARQALRDQLIPRSAPLTDIRQALLAQEGRFRAVELNIVLQPGVNDTPEDLQALLGWAHPRWTVVLNPLMREDSAVVSTASAWFEDELRAAGRRVRRYEQVGSAIVRQGVYPLLRARQERRR